MALEGTLDDMPLTDLFQVFRIGSKSGVLLLVAGVEHGLIYIKDGRPIDAVVLRGAERLVAAVGEEAVIRLLQWEAADFTFRHTLSVDERPVRIVHDSEWLVLEGLRRRSNLSRTLPHATITLETRFDLAATPISTATDMHLNLDQWRILSQIAVTSSVRELCTSTGIAPEQAIRALHELLAIGMVELALPAHTPPRPQRPRPERPNPLLQATRASIGQLPGGDLMPSNAGRGLLQAVMRRVRGL